MVVVIASKIAADITDPKNKWRLPQSWSNQAWHATVDEKLIDLHLTYKLGGLLHTCCCKPRSATNCRISSKCSRFSANLLSKPPVTTSRGAAVPDNPCTLSWCRAFTASGISCNTSTICCHGCVNCGGARLHDWTSRWTGTAMKKKER